MAVRKVKTATPAPSSINLPVPAPDPELSASAKRLLKQAQSIVVSTAEEYEAAAAVMLTLSEREHEIEAKKATIWDPLAKLTRACQALFNPPLKVVKQAKDIVKEKMGTYAVAQQSIQREKQRIADQEAEDARRKLLARAEQAADDGNRVRAAVIEARARSVQAPTIESETPKVAGVQLRERWLFEVTDEADVPDEYRSVDEAKIRRAVDTYHDKIEIRGVRIWSTLKPQG
jgi:hypothetical protein